MQNSLHACFYWGFQICKKLWTKQENKKTKNQQLAKMVAKLLSNLHMVIKLELDCKLKAIQRHTERQRERESEEAAAVDEDALSRWHLQSGAYLPHVSKLEEFQLESLSLQCKWVQMSLRKSSNSRKQS
jgi:hypothetical protein